MYVCACVCVLSTLPLEWSGRNKVLFTLPVKQCYFPPPRVCGNVLVRSYVRGAWGGGGGGWYINDCARACMHACVCVHELVHKLRYDGINEVYNHICLAVFPYFSIYLSIYAHIRTHTHTYIYVCVFGCSHIRQRIFLYISKALTHKKIDRLIDSRYIYRYTVIQTDRQKGRYIMYIDRLEWSVKSGTSSIYPPKKTVLKINFIVPSFTHGPSYGHEFYIHSGSAF